MTDSMAPADPSWSPSPLGWIPIGTQLETKPKWPGAQLEPSWNPIFNTAGTQLEPRKSPAGAQATLATCTWLLLDLHDLIKLEPRRSPAGAQLEPRRDGKRGRVVIEVVVV